MASCRSSKFLITLVFSSLLTGCSVFYPPTGVHKIGENADYIHFDSNNRGAFVFKEDPQNRSNPYMLCAEPAPETSLKFLSEGNLKLSTPNNESALSGGGSLSTDVVQLVHHSQITLFAREALYRLCELQLNRDGLKTGITAIETQRLFSKVLDSVIALSSTSSLASLDINTRQEAVSFEYKRSILETQDLKNRKNEILNKLLELKHSDNTVIYNRNDIEEKATSNTSCKSNTSPDVQETCDRLINDLNFIKYNIVKSTQKCATIRPTYIQEVCSGQETNCPIPATSSSCQN